MGAAAGKKRSIVISFIVFTLILFSGRGLFAQDSETDSLFKAGIEHHKKGIQLYSIGEKKEALKSFDKAASAFKDHLYELQTKVDSLRLIYSGLLGEYPKSPVLHYAMGLCEYLKKRDSVGLAAAKIWFDKAIAIEPDFVFGYNGLASLAGVKQDNAEIIRLYRKILEIEPERLSTAWALSSMLSRNGKNEEADKIRNMVIRIDSASDYSIRSIMDFAREEKSLDAKKQYFDKALRLVKDKWELQSIISTVLRTYQTEAPELAIDYSEKILRKEIGGTDRYNRMRALETMVFVYMNKMKDKEKIMEFSELAYKDDNVRVLADLGRYFADTLKNKELGLKFYNKAYEIASGPTVENVLAFGSGKSSDKFYVQSANRFKYGSMAAAIGKLYYEMKDYSNAEKYLLETIPIYEPEGVNYTHEYLGYTLMDSGRKEEAVKWLVKALAIKYNPECEKKLNELVSDLKSAKTGEELVREERMKTAKPAPAFELPDMNGNMISLASLKGKVVMVDFWATWCGPCVSEIPHLIKLYEKYKDNRDVVFYGIDVNENKTVIDKYMKEKGFSFNVLLGEGTKVQENYQVTGIPTKFLIDREGRIQFKHVGYSAKSDVVAELSKEIDELLKIK